MHALQNYGKPLVWSVPGHAILSLSQVGGTCQVPVKND